MSIEQVAQQTMEQHLKQNSYPGRGLVLGLSPSKKSVQIVYFIMGRSVNSQNRRFVAQGDRLYTEPVDLSKVTDPSLIIYDAMLRYENNQIVSNGDQTTTIFDALAKGGNFEGALATREREPDAPNYTPRISGMITFEETQSFQLSILKANKATPEKTDRTLFCPAAPAPGIGYGLTTYRTDGNPLPSFEGDPLVLPIGETAAATLEMYWNALNDNNRVSLAVKEINLQGDTTALVIKNRHQ